MIRRRLRRPAKKCRLWLEACWSQFRRAAAFVAGTIVVAAASVLVPDVIDRLRPDSPLYRVSVERSPDRIQFETTSAGGSYILDGPIDHISAPPVDADSCVGRFEWAQGYDAVQADTEFVRLRVDATGDEPVYITGLDLLIDDSRPPLRGIHLACPGRGGQIDDRLVNADLSSNPPTVAPFGPLVAPPPG